MSEVLRRQGRGSVEYAAPGCGNSRFQYVGKETVNVGADDADHADNEDLADQL